MKPKTPYTWGFIIRVVIKAMVLFIIANVLFAWLQPMDAISRLSLYNSLFVGRERLPYGENSAEAYTLTTDNIPAMFATHEINRPKADDEYRVLLVGDSATWGFLLPSDETLASQLTDMGYLLADGRRVVAYNIGHPVMSLTKDLLLLDEAMTYQPDMVIWLVTLQSFSDKRQLGVPMTQNNPQRLRDLISTYGLSFNPDDKRFNIPDFFGQTLIGQRRALADWLRIQLYGAMWSATGIDHVVNDYTLRRSDFDEDISWENFDDPQLFTVDDIAFDLIRAGHERVGEIPLIIVNEPMFISTGQNSDLRYNNFYPRWAYDSYRALFAELAAANNWQYCDLWDAMPAESFTDSPVHMTAEATGDVSRLLGEMLTDYLEFGYLGRDCD
ncbi:MAG: SGNH/GDSL hydrolase family protein [bacterium]|nr:SGNH/GDSL hydrolase family protein [bacterium]